ncbi:CE1 family esterase [Humidesulfovibrio idahonensis]
MGARPHFAATPVRGFWPAAALVLCVLLGPAQALCAQSAGGMVQDALDSLTKSPDSRDKGHGVSQGGPVAPQQPKAPQVPGAANASQGGSFGAGNKGEADPFRPGQAQPNQPNQAGRKQAPANNQARQQVLTLRHDGVDRRALLTLPKAAPLKKGQAAPKTPVIIVLHGAGGSALQAMRQTGLAGRAAAAGYLAVFPDGLGPAEANGEGQTWNAWTCCGYARDQRVDDVGFLSALINRLRTDYGADPRRIYLAGFSNGAMLASRFVLERSGAAAALAVVAGYLPCDAPRPAEPLPVLIIHGAQDNVARVAPTKAHPATGRFCEDHPARAQVDHWVNGMDLSPKGQVRDSAAVRVEEYGPANGSAKAGGRGQVRVVIVKNGGHAWPGGARERYRYCDAPSAGPDATGLVLEFFGRQQGGPAAPAKAAVKAGAKAKK